MSYLEKMFHVCVLTWGIAFFSAIAYADTNKTLPQKKPLGLELQTKINNIGEWTKERPEVVSQWSKNEWEEIKEFQKKNWEQGKEQNAKNFAKLKSFFVSLVDNKE